MNSDMVKPKKHDPLQLVFHLTILLKGFIEKSLPGSTIANSSLTSRSEDEKTSPIIYNTNGLLSTLPEVEKTRAAKE